MSIYWQAEARFDWRAYVESQGAVRSIRGRADEFLMACPDCQKAKLAVNVERRAWQCFTCGDTGRDAASLVAKVQQMLWKDAIALVLTGQQRVIGAIDQIEFKPPQEQSRPRSWIPKPMPYPESWEPVTTQSRAGMLAVAYCMQRNIPEYVVAEMKLGVCSRGRFANRLMFPVFDSGGRLIFYQGRAMSKPRAYERFIKTLSPRSDTTVEAGPADCLLNLQYLIDHAKTERVLLVEGPVDVAHAWPDAVGLFGKRISGRQIELLMRAGVKELDLGLDPDAAADALKVAPMLADLFTLRVVRWPLGSDPGSLTKDAIEDYRAQAVLWGTGDRLLKLTDTIR